jgi:hypothetical protein
MNHKPSEIDIGVEKGWAIFSLNELKEIGNILYERIQVTAEELKELKKGIFATINVNSNQRFEDEESSKILLKTLEAQERWFQRRGI